MAPKSSSKGAKVTVRRKAVSRMAKSTERNASPKPLPKDWPVTSQPPTFPAGASALMPGSLLRRQCNGQDIHLSKSAVMTPNIGKGKGRYLLLLPGNLSFKEAALSVAPAATATSSSAFITPSSQLSSHEPSQNQDQEELSTQAQEPTPLFTSKKTLPQLGRIEGLDTDKPRFVISFPATEKQMVFPGKKVPTTSKYMVLTCSTKKKGSVTCKSIFSTAIVFGQPKWETGAMKEQELQNSSSSLQVLDEESEPDEHPQDDSTYQPATIVHYGGSERTVDGAGRTSKKSSRNSSEHVAKRPLLAIYCKQQAPSPNAFFPSLEERDLEDDETTSAPGTLESSATIEVLDNSSDDEFFAMETRSPTTTAATRSVPKRRASVQRTTKYTLDSSSDDDGDDQEKDDDEVEVISSQRKASAQKNESGGRREAGGEVKKARVQAPSNQASSHGTFNDNSDSDPYLENIDDEVKIIRRPSSRRQSAGRKSYKEMDDGPLVESESSESELEVKPVAVKSRKTTPEAQGVVAKNVSGKKTSSVSKEGLGSTTASNGGKNNPDAPAWKAKSVAKRAPVASRAAKPVVDHSRSKIAKSSDRNGGSIKSIHSPSSLSSRSPGFRSRHRKRPTSTTKKSPKVLDLSQDDGFNFG